MTWITWFGYALMCLIYGTSFLAIKLGLGDGMPPFLAAGLRFAIAGGLLCLCLGLSKRWQSLDWRTYLELAWIGFCMTTVPFAALYWAEQHIDSGEAALLVATSPLFSAILALLFRQLTFTWMLVAGLLLSGGGMVFVIGETPSAFQLGSLPFYGKLAIVLSEFIHGLGAIHAKRLMDKVSPATLNGWQMVFASFGLFALSLLIERNAQVDFTPVTLLSLLHLSIVVSIVASGLFYWLMRETNPLFPVTWTYVSPVIAVAVGALFLNERVTLAHIIGGACVLIGIIVMNLKTKQPRSDSSTTSLSNANKPTSV
ncbi:DMT family transporter [Laceyella sacchari]|jgi:drug/metabolite transporter (DMT)-like permease|uniref:EamA family transporter n=1 Tax=Laceyella sacchari TaxID=37482 RepID=A0ABY5U413_LACSH|nr:EamA family transporter [Laceyella sacchari]UWE04379.1 EamA family transporter [Laceyella sacchari]